VLYRIGAQKCTVVEEVCPQFKLISIYEGDELFATAVHKVNNNNLTGYKANQKSLLKTARIWNKKIKKPTKAFISWKCDGLESTVWGAK